MSDLLVHFLERVLGERELSLMRNAPDAVKKIALAITITVTVVEIIVFWIVFSLIYGQHIDALHATIGLKDERITSLQSALNSTAKGTDTPLSLGKYVCTTSLSEESGKYALLVEFGVRKGQTNGFHCEVKFAKPYTQRNSWFGGPLRTDKQGVAVIITAPTPSEADESDHLLYWRRVMSPAITPQMSFYFYFESDQPLQVGEIFFLEDYFALSDQMRANALAIKYDPCPR